MLRRLETAKGWLDELDETAADAKKVGSKDATLATAIRQLGHIIFETNSEIVHQIDGMQERLAERQDVEL